MISCRMVFFLSRGIFLMIGFFLMVDQRMLYFLCIHNHKTTKEKYLNRPDQRFNEL